MDAEMKQLLFDTAKRLLATDDAAKVATALEVLRFVNGRDVRWKDDKKHGG